MRLSGTQMRLGNTAALVLTADRGGTLGYDTPLAAVSAGARGAQSDGGLAAQPLPTWGQLAFRRFGGV